MSFFRRPRHEPLHLPCTADGRWTYSGDETFEVRFDHVGVRGEVGKERDTEIWFGSGEFLGGVEDVGDILIFSRYSRG